MSEDDNQARKLMAQREPYRFGSSYRNQGQLAFKKGLESTVNYPSTA